MPSIDLSTGYVEDWQAFDFVEAAEYDDPPGAPDERTNVAVKAKLDDEAKSVTGVGGVLSYSDAGEPCVVWPHSEPALELRVGGTLRLATSGVYQIKTATKSRFGVWSLTVEPLREGRL